MSTDWTTAFYLNPGVQRPTQDEIMRVRRYECSMNGHSWSVTLTADSEDPKFLLCDHCGRRLKVVGDDES